VKVIKKNNVFDFGFYNVLVLLLSVSTFTTTELVLVLTVIENIMTTFKSRVYSCHLWYKILTHIQLCGEYSLCMEGVTATVSVELVLWSTPCIHNNSWTSMSTSSLLWNQWP